jgi:UDP-glucose:(heptosyl)LPS alpha-1,3-glucosyltransferase
MDLALLIFEYFPYGGRQRNALAIAEACLQAGHRVTAFATRWDGPQPDGLTVVRLPVRAWTNIGREIRLQAALRRAWKPESFAATLAFGRYPGADLYYAADPCAEWERQRRGWAFRLSRRCRRRCAWERDMLRSGADVLVLTESARQSFQQAYGVPAERLHLLPPNLPRGRFTAATRAAEREPARATLGVAPADRLVLMVTSYFHTKGVDRAIAALAALPPALREATRLMVAGSGKPGPFMRQAARHGVAAHLRFLGSRDDMTALYAAADLLLHPARVENTGTVLLEALAMGVPVLTTDVCGYASHIAAAGAGVVLAEPFAQDALDRALASALADAAQRASWSAAALAYAGRTDLSGRAERAAAIFLARAERNRRTRP